MEILNRDSFEETGFAGVREHRLIKDPKVFGPNANLNGSCKGLGNFVYLADARFIPKGGTYLHKHDNIDIITVMVKGRLTHEGSLGHGQELNLKDVQVQISGGEGFSHDEVNPDNSWNRLIQIWLEPEKSEGPAGYKIFHPCSGKLTRVYGGPDTPDTPFPAKTTIDIGLLLNSQEISLDKEFIMYIIRGTGKINGRRVQPGDLIRADKLNFKASENTHLILVTTV